MERYIGTKIVKAELMDEAVFSLQVRFVNNLVPVTPDGQGRPGYLVIYEDGYKSWSPKDVFERAYRLITRAEMELLG